LAGNTPVAYIFHPVHVGFRPIIRMKANLTGFDGLSSRLGQLLHFHEPLFRKIRLNNIVTAVASTDRELMFFNFFKMPFLGQFFDKLLAGVEAVEKNRKKKTTPSASKNSIRT